jgi:sulfite reductase alpha subunit-like flavoprotein
MTNPVPLSPASSSSSLRGVSRSDGEEDTNGPIDKVVILYASETGNAQDTAERVGREFRRVNRRCTVLSMDMFDVVSTTDGAWPLPF